MGSVSRNIKRNLKFERSWLGRDSRRREKKLASPYAGAKNKKIQRKLLHRARYARLLVGLLIRATGCAAPPLQLEAKVQTPFQKRTLEAEFLANTGGQLSTMTALGTSHVQNRKGEILKVSL